jgi:hypothetical protein
MKKQLFYIIFLGIFSQGCKECEEKVKIRRTVNKTIALSYKFNATGSSTNMATISSNELNKIFDIESDAKLEKIDVQGVSLSGEIDKTQNTATFANLSAQVSTLISAEPNVPSKGVVLLKETKLIKVNETDLATDLMGVGGSFPTYTFNNAISSLNQDALIIIRNFFASALFSISAALNQKLDVEIYSSVPPNQRLVGTVYLRLSVSVTYTQCEAMPKGLFYTDEKCN